MRFPRREISQQDSGMFFKLKDGESKKGVLRGELYEFYMLWQNNKSVLVTKETAGAKPRYRANIVVWDEEQKKFVAQIWEMSQTVCNQLADIAEEYDLTKMKIKVTRRGTQTDTVYNVLPLETINEKISPPVMKQIEAVQLQVLEHKNPPTADPQKAQPPAGHPHETFDDIPPIDDSEIPF